MKFLLARLDAPSVKKTLFRREERKKSIRAEKPGRITCRQSRPNQGFSSLGHLGIDASFLMIARMMMPNGSFPKMSVMLRIWVKLAAVTMRMQKAGVNLWHRMIQIQRMNHRTR